MQKSIIRFQARFFSALKPAILKSELVPQQPLQFVSKNPLLKQINLRSSEDHFFPKIKKSEEVDRQDIIDLLRSGGKEELLAIISGLNTSNPDKAKVILREVFDKSIELTWMIFDKMQVRDKEMLNLYAWSASHFRHQTMLASVMYQAAILGHQIDL